MSAGTQEMAKNAALLEIMVDPRCLHMDVTCSKSRVSLGLDVGLRKFLLLIFGTALAWYLLLDPLQHRRALKKTGKK